MSMNMAFLMAAYGDETDIGCYFRKMRSKEMSFQDGRIPGEERRINLDKLNQNDPWVTVVWIPSLDGLGKMEVLTMLASQYLEWAKRQEDFKHIVLRGSTEEVNVKPVGYLLEKK